MQMYNGTSNVLGLMSGTSLDGMDAALVRFSEGDQVLWELLEYRHFQYPKELLELVKKAFSSPDLLPAVDIAFAEWSIRFSSSYRFDRNPWSNNISPTRAKMDLSSRMHAFYFYQDRYSCSC